MLVILHVRMLALNHVFVCCSVFEIRFCECNAHTTESLVWGSPVMHINCFHSMILIKFKRKQVDILMSKNQVLQILCLKHHAHKTL